MKLPGLDGQRPRKRKRVRRGARYFPLKGKFKHEGMTAEQLRTDRRPLSDVPKRELERRVLHLSRVRAGFEEWVLSLEGYAEKDKVPEIKMEILKIADKIKARVKTIIDTAAGVK